MKPDWRIDLSICTVGCTVERIEQKPSRRVYIPKADGRQTSVRHRGAWEDKIVQQAVVTILNQIYEVDFKGFSYGFRPGRGPTSSAGRADGGASNGKRVNWVLDADIRGFFDNMNHEWTMKFVEHRVADRRVLRLIQKWFEGGSFSEDGQLVGDETRYATRSRCVTTLANVYLHYVFDLWVEVWRKESSEGRCVIVVRYADDLCGGLFNTGQTPSGSYGNFGSGWPSSVWNYMRTRRELIEFGRFCRSRPEAARRGKKPETFTFLGFTHFCGQLTNGAFHRSGGSRRRRKRMVAKLKVY